MHGSYTELNHVWKYVFNKHLDIFFQIRKPFFLGGGLNIKIKIVKKARNTQKFRTN